MLAVDCTHKEAAMPSSNGSAQVESSHPRFEQQFEAVKANVKKWIDRIAIKPSGEPTRLRKLADRTGEAIKAHPIAAVGIAVGAGYLVIRVLRRR